MASARRVLFIIPSLCGGGAERVIVTLLRHLDRSKFRLALAVVDMRSAVFLRDVPTDVELIDLSCTRVRYALYKIVRLIWLRKPEIVFSTLGHLNLALAIVRPMLPHNIRYVARETTVISEEISGCSHPWIWRLAYKLFYGRFENVICQSIDMRNDLITNFGFSGTKAIVIANPVDIERIRQLAALPMPQDFSANDRARGFIYLVAAGRLSPEKGFDILIEALALCGNLRLKLTLLGDGPQRGELERLAKSKGIDHQIQFVGFQTNPYPFFASADVFVLSSRYEGFPNVVLEALVCGTPVIATPAPGGVREILATIPECLIVEKVDAEALSAGITKWVSGPKSRVGTSTPDPYSIGRIVCAYAEAISCETSR